MWLPSSCTTIPQWPPPPCSQAGAWGPEQAETTGTPPGDHRLTITLGSVAGLGALTNHQWPRGSSCPCAPVDCSCRVLLDLLCDDLPAQRSLVQTRYSRCSSARPTPPRVPFSFSCSSSRCAEQHLCRFGSRLPSGISNYFACLRKVTTRICILPGMTGKPGVLPSMGSQRVGHDWATGQQQRADSP